MLPLNKLHDFPPSQHDACVLCSDLEPDDVLAIAILANQIPKDFPLLVITGEGNLDKSGLGHNICQHFGFTNFQIIHGDYSTKTYPENALLSFGDVFPDKNSEKYAEENSRLLLANFLDQYQSPLIISIKPMRELKDIPIHLTQKCVLVKYGSFNLRCMFDQWDKNEMANFINTRFKQVLLYESFPATGTNNSINKNNAPALFQALQNQHETYQGLFNLVLAWNQYIVNDCWNEIYQIVGKLPEIENALGQIHRSISSQ